MSGRCREALFARAPRRRSDRQRRQLGRQREGPPLGTLGLRRRAALPGPRDLKIHIPDAIIRFVDEGQSFPLFRTDAQFRVLGELYTNPGLEATVGALAGRLGVPLYGPPARIRAALATIPGVQRAAIFGSWAERWQGTPGSVPGDIDVLVVGDVDHDAGQTGSTGRCHPWSARGHAFAYSAVSGGAGRPVAVRGGKSGMSVPGFSVCPGDERAVRTVKLRPEPLDATSTSCSMSSSN